MAGDRTSKTTRERQDRVPNRSAAFLGRFAVAESTAQISGSEFGFSFRSDPGVSTEHTFAEIGEEIITAAKAAAKDLGVPLMVHIGDFTARDDASAARRGELRL